MKPTTVLSSLFLVAVVGSGCNFTEKYCERTVECMGDMAGTVDECVTASENAAADADEAGCGAEYDDAAKCAYLNSECESMDMGGGTMMDMYTSGDACTAENEAYGACMAGAVTGTGTGTGTATGTGTGTATGTGTGTATGTGTM